MAINVTVTLESFSGWLLAGFGAAFALILSNIESVSNFITVGSIRRGVFLFLIALAAGVVQRWIGSSVRAGVLSGSEGEVLGDGAHDSIDFSVILEEIKKATFYPQRWLVAWSFKKIEKGDFAFSGRMFAKMAQIQGWLVLVQAALVISSIVVVVNGLES
jgi:hypothetical protein